MVAGRHRYFLRSSGVQYRVKERTIHQLYGGRFANRIDTMEIEVGAVGAAAELVLLDNQDELGRQTVVGNGGGMGRTTYEWLSAMKDLLMTKRSLPDRIRDARRTEHSLHTSANRFSR